MVYYDKLKKSVAELPSKVGKETPRPFKVYSCDVLNGVRVLVLKATIFDKGILWGVINYLHYLGAPIVEVYRGGDIYIRHFKGDNVQW